MPTIRDFIPPIVFNFLKRPKVKRIYASYADALAHCDNSSGYEDNELVQVVLEKTKRFKQSLAESDCIDIDTTTAFAVTALDMCIRSTNEISVLDFGGACGAQFFHFKKILPHCKFNWVVVETSAMCKADELSFYDDIEVAASKMEKIDLLLSSSTLMYLENSLLMLKKITSLKAQYIFLTRLSLTKGINDIITVQESWLSENGNGKLPETFKDRVIKYPHTNVNERNFKEILSENYKLKAMFNDQSGVNPVNKEPIIGYGALFQIIAS